MLHIKSSKLWYWDNRGYLTKGELSKVTKVEGNNVFLDLSARESYYISGETLTVNAYTPKKLTIEHIEFKHPQPMSTVMEKVGFTENALFQDMIIRNSKKIGLLLDKTLNSHVTKSFISLGTTPDIPSGYGVQDYGGRHNIISYSTFANVRRGVDFSGDTPSRFGVVNYSKAYGPVKNTLAAGNSGFGTHSTAEDITFHNNTVTGFNYGFVSRGNRITISDNTMTGNSVSFTAISYGNNVTLLRNHFQKSSLDGNSLEHFALVHASYKGKITAEQNKVEYLTRDFVRFAGTELQSLRLVDNRANVYTDLNPMYVIRSGQNIKLQNPTLLRNYMWTKIGTNKYVSKTVDLSDKSNQIDYIH